MSMKTFFLLSPVLWLRKVLVYLLATFILLGILVYFVANSPWVIKKAVDIFAPDYNITYSRIHGNAISGVKIEDVAYNNQPLAKYINLKWNPNDLLKKEILVNHATLNHVNVDTIKTLIGAFSSNENTKSDTFAFSINLKKLTLTIDPFVEEAIYFQNIVLHAKDIFYTSDEIEVEHVDLVIDSNVTKISLKASLEENVFNVDELSVQDLDVLAIQHLFVSDENESIVPEENSTKTEEIQNPLIPKELRVRRLSIGIIPLMYDSVEVDSLTVGLKNALFDIPTLVLKKAVVSIDAKTNLANAIHQGNIENNQLIGHLKLLPKELLFTHYDLPLRRESIGAIVIDLDASQERVIASLDTNISQLLKTEKGAFNVDIDTLQSTVTYVLESASLKANTRAKVSTPYAENIVINNILTMDDTLSYSGDVRVKQITGVDAKYVKVVNDLKLTYTGDDKSIHATIDSAGLKGTFISDDFKEANLHLESKEALVLRDYVTLPAELNASRASVEIDVPFTFESNASYVATIKVKSNVANIDANVSYKDTLHLVSLMDVPKDSLLRPYSDKLKWDVLMPIKVEADLLEEGIEAKILSGTLKTKARYDFNSTAVKGSISLGGIKVNISGIAEKEINIDSNITAIPLLVKSIADIYTLEALPKVEGSAKISLLIKELKAAKLSVTSPLIVYHSDHKTATDISDINMLVQYKEGKVVLDHYKVTVKDEEIYATKPSTLSFENNFITLKPLWVNDALKAEGSYDLKTKKGKVLVNADKLHISHEMIDLDSNIDITALLDANKTNVQGKVVLLGGEIHYDLSKKSFASDSDILIVQDMKEEEPSVFMDNLSVEMQVSTKKPLVYKKGAINMKAKVDVGIHKVEHSELLVLGTVEILKGGTYMFQNKKFVIDSGFVHFTGNPSKPLLDIKVKYKALNHLVTVGVTGNADLPQISFSSKPSLSKEQILSLILFDTEAGAGTNSGDDMMKMMGGAMAKSALNNIGIKLDHLVLGEGNSIEVGKKLTDKITIIYVNDIVSEVKLKYQHSPHTESLIGASEQSQSYDIIYKIDF